MKIHEGVRNSSSNILNIPNGVSDGLSIRAKHCSFHSASSGFGSLPASMSDTDLPVANMRFKELEQGT